MHSSTGTVVACTVSLSSTSCNSADYCWLLNGTPCMSQAGCAVNREFFNVMHCDTKTGGGFSLEHGVRHGIAPRHRHMCMGSLWMHGDTIGVC